MKWLLLLLFDPASALDWHDSRSHGLDHGKVVADLVIFSLCFATVLSSLRTNTFPPWPVVALLIVGAMGSRAMMSLIKAWAGKMIP